MHTMINYACEKLDLDERADDIELEFNYIPAKYDINKQNYTNSMT
jgi:hypothetical protein